MEYAFTMQLINQLEGSRLMHLRTVSFWEKAARHKAQGRSKFKGGRRKRRYKAQKVTTLVPFSLLLYLCIFCASLCLVPCSFFPPCTRTLCLVAFPKCFLR
jgi:hypothetical protein